MAEEKKDATDKTLLIDGDILFYRAACVADQSAEFGDIEVRWADDYDVIKAFKSVLSGLLSSHEWGDVVIAKSDDRKNFREGLLPEYKANRDPASKPTKLKFIKQYALDNYKTVWHPRIEADDVLGIYATSTKYPHDTVIWSADKDLMQVPGKHLVRNKIVEVSEIDGDWQWLTLSLTGDVVDNYKGCPMIGPVKADRLLQRAVDEFPNLPLDEAAWPFIVEAYEKKGLTEEDALLQARISRVLRYGDYEFETNKVRLWRPYDTIS